MDAESRDLPGGGIRLEYTPDRPLMLFTDFPPDAQGGANVIINGLVTNEERQCIVRVSPCEPLNPQALGGQEWITLRSGSLGQSRRGKRSWLLDTLWYWRALADEVLTHARRRNARALWVVLHNAGVPVAVHLIQRARLPVHVGVNDDPPYAVALRSRKALLFVPWFAWMFARALKMATSVDTTSESMARRYQAKYGISSVVVHRGLRGPIQPNSAFSRSGGEFPVGILGNVYCYAQLPLLGRALARAATRVGARPRIIIIGQGYGERLRRELAADGVEVEVLGHIPESAAVNQLRKCFALYLNYPFGLRDRVLRRTSFPVKLSTYLLATRPVLFHAPTDTSLEGLSRLPEFVRHWTNLDTDDGMELLSRWWEEPTADAHQTIGAEAVRQMYYDFGRHRSALIEALNRLAYLR